MSESIIGDHLWAEMTEGQKAEAVLKGLATLEQMREVLLGGSDKLRDACHDLLAQAGAPFEELPVAAKQANNSLETSDSSQNKAPHPRRPNSAKHRSSDAFHKQRFGLPKNFVPRLQRYGRGILLELNIYRLPNGREFIPSQPTGTLGTRHHLYALLSSEQYLKAKRGSVYVRTDGRIFDYSVDGATPSGDIFDTGYTIYDLERTGRYAPVRARRRKKSQPAKARRAVAG